MPKLNIVVLDYSNAKVHLFNNQTIPGPIDGQDEEEVVTEFLASKEFRLSNCSWMFSKEKIESINH